MRSGFARQRRWFEHACEPSAEPENRCNIEARCNTGKSCMPTCFFHIKPAACVPRKSKLQNTDRKRSMTSVQNIRCYPASSGVIRSKRLLKRQSETHKRRPNRVSLLVPGCRVTTGAKVFGLLSTPRQTTYDCPYATRDCATSTWPYDRGVPPPDRRFHHRARTLAGGDVS